jgi:ABC-type uncharacterized transport system substrate-binding protein
LRKTFPATSGGSKARTGGSGSFQRSISTILVPLLGPWLSFDVPRSCASRFQFVLNMKTAKAIGLKIPEAIILRADKVIE